MYFWYRVQMWFRQFMQGRYGADALTRAQLWTGLALYVVNLFLRSNILVFLALALYLWAIFRIFSRNRVARAKENQRFLELWYSLKQKPGQYKLRFQNRKEYKYFHCPKCHTVLRSRRGGGQRAFTCPKCGHTFEKKL